jgi:hypothetical protein
MSPTAMPPALVNNTIVSGVGQQHAHVEIGGPWEPRIGESEHKRTSLEVSADIIEHVDPIFFADPRTAAVKALALT